MAVTSNAPAAAYLLSKLSSLSQVKMQSKLLFPLIFIDLEMASGVHSRVLDFIWFVVASCVSCLCAVMNNRGL